MKGVFFLFIIILIISSCSNSDEDEGDIQITVDIQEGILGQWNVEWECDNRIHKFEFLEENNFNYHFMGDVNNGIYSLSGRNLVISGYNDIGGGREEYEIMVLTENRLELDNPRDFGIDYRFVRVCD